MAGARGPMVVTHEDGVRFAVQLREHRLVVDQPLGAGAGQNAGPMPLEHLEILHVEVLLLTKAYLIRLSEGVNTVSGSVLQSEQKTRRNSFPSPAK